MKDGEMEGGREGGREGESEKGIDEGSDGGREGGREEERERGIERRKEGGREGVRTYINNTQEVLIQYLIHLSDSLQCILYCSLHVYTDIHNTQLIQYLM